MFNPMTILADTAAQTTGGDAPVHDPLTGVNLLGAVVFALVGVVVFVAVFWVIVKISPFSVRKEIEEDQNSALAIIIGAVMLGIAVIIAAAIHGG